MLERIPYSRHIYETIAIVAHLTKLLLMVNIGTNGCRFLVKLSVLIMLAWRLLQLVMISLGIYHHCIHDS